MTRRENHEQLYRLLRQSFGLSQDFSEILTPCEWKALFRLAVEQSVAGVCYQGVSGLSTDLCPPIDVAVQWSAMAEMIRGLNKQDNEEAARLTQLFAAEHHRSAILKGQANARLYPDPLSRQPGDIDIWVEGGIRQVVAVCHKLFGDWADQGELSYHHLHLKGGDVPVEVHFRPSSGNYNVVTNRRLQWWVEREIRNATMTDLGFCVPSVRFALVMQLAHIQHHFIGEGIGLRHVCDYYMLLTHSSRADRDEVAGLLRGFGLLHMAGALMWVIVHVLHAGYELMLCRPDEMRGRWLLQEMEEGGNFGRYSERESSGMWHRVYESRKRDLRLIRFDACEAIWKDIKYWLHITATLGTRIRHRSFTLRGIEH